MTSTSDQYIIQNATEQLTTLLNKIAPSVEPEPELLALISQFSSWFAYADGTPTSIVGLFKYHEYQLEESVLDAIGFSSYMNSPITGISFDDYDNSVEIYVDNTDWEPTLDMWDRIWTLGFSIGWINYPDGSEICHSRTSKSTPHKTKTSGVRTYESSHRLKERIRFLENELKSSHLLKERIDFLENDMYLQRYNLTLRQRLSQFEALAQEARELAHMVRVMRNVAATTALTAHIGYEADFMRVADVWDRLSTE